MKKLFFILALITSYVCHSQDDSTKYIWYKYQYGSRMPRFWADSVMKAPAFNSMDDAKASGRAGNIAIDSVGGGRGLWYYEGGTWKHVLDSANVVTSVLTNNGIGKSGDTLQLKDSLTRYTYLQAKVNGINNTPFRGITIGNLPEAQSLNGLIGYNPLFNTYNPATLGLQRIYSTANGDIDSSFYGGLISTIFRISRDSDDVYFKAGVRSELLPGLGGEFVGQYFPPRDTMVVKVGRDGQSGNVLFGQLDWGQAWGYKSYVKPESTLPGFPISAGRTSIDLSRVIDNTRSKQLSGAGVAGFTTMYKTYQTTITGSTYETGSFTDSIFGFRAYGDAYPLINRDTKAKALAVWNARNVFGVYVDPQYRYTNTTDNAYSFYAAGDTDLFVNRGFAYFGPTATQPVRSANAEGLRYRIYNTGKYWGTDSVHSSITDAYGFSAQVPISIGNETGMNFLQKDSAITGTIGANLSTNRDARYLYFRSEGYSAANYPDASAGMYLRFETGANHANVSRVSRNGNWTMGNSAAVLAYRYYKKLAVDGGGVFRDTLKLEVAPLQVVDTTNYKVVVRNTTSGDLLTMPWVGGSGGGGSGLTVGTTTITSGTDTKVLFDNAGTLGEYTINGSGNVAMTTSPTFTTDITTPKIIGSTSSGGTLTLSTTSNATKGKILFGTSAYDEVNNRLGIGTTSPAGSIDIGNGSAILGSIATSSIGLNGNLYTGNQGSMIGSTNSNYLLPGGTRTTFRVAVNGNTSTTLGVGEDGLDLLLTGSVSTEAASGTHPRIGTFYVGGKVITNGAGSVDTLFGSYFNGPATGVTPNVGSWSAIFNSGNVLIKQGRLAVGTTTATTSLLHLGAGTTSVAPMRFTSGSLTTGGNILAGNVEFLTDTWYGTTTTGPAQYPFTMNNAALTDNRIPYVSNGRLSDAGTFGFNGAEFTLQGAIKYSTAQISTTTTLTSTQYVVRVDASGGAVTVNLPDATTVQGRTYTIKLISSSANAMTIDGNGSQTIDGATTVSTSTQYATYEIQSNGTNWDILSKF